MQTDNKGIITLQNPIAECKISLFGGQVLSYRPKTQKHDIFWLGDLNKFDNIQAIRGGVPVCWPRFGEEKLNSHLPRHGFARLCVWTLKNSYVDNEKMSVHLSLLPDEKYVTKLSADLFIKITDKLEYRLKTTNFGEQELCFSEALHAYFYVGLRNNILLKGLNNHSYKNALDGNTYNLKEDLQVAKKFDAIFTNHKSCVEIVDNELNRVIKISKTGSNSTVVWNPDADVKEATNGQYNHFICVEPANLGDLFVRLAPKEKHEISMTINVNNIK